MAVFQITTRTAPSAKPPKKRRATARKAGRFVLIFFLGTVFISTFAALAGITRFNFLFFVLLPVCVSVFNMTIFHVYSRKIVVLRTLIAFIYFSIVIAWELLTHHPGTDEIIVVCTTLALAVMFEPLRDWVQSLMEQHFHLRNDEAIRAFIATLREEIDLDNMRDGLFTVIQRTMQPYSVSLWVRASGEQQKKSDGSEEIVIADDDALVVYLLHHSGVSAINRLRIDSSAVENVQSCHAELLLPLTSQGELIGLLVVGPHLKRYSYTREERTMLDTLAQQVAPALRIAQVVQEQQAQVRERERIEQELRTARFIQRSLLPKEVPALPGWQIAPYYQPAREVGGDFYDFLPFEDGRLGIILGDVTDKGVPAALVMTTTHAMLRTIAPQTLSPGETLAKVNDLLYAETPASMFVTCFYAILDPANGRMRFANAGQDLPCLRHDGNVSELWATGMPLGLMPGSCYDEHEITLAPGDSLLFYSDGLAEAHNPKREMFDTPRLMKLLAEHTDETPTIDFLLDKLKRFTGENWEQEDDITLVTLQRAPGACPVDTSSNTPQQVLDLSIASIPGNEQQAIERVGKAVQPLHLPAERFASLKTAVAEAVMNAMEHGNHYAPDKAVGVQVLTTDAAVIVRIRDNGEGAHDPIPFDETPDLEAKLAGRETPRGWGLFLIKHLVDELRVSNDEHDHTIELIMLRHAETTANTCIE